MFGSIAHCSLQPSLLKGAGLDYRSQPHPYVIVMTSVCDLEQDFNIQFSDDSSWDSFSSA